MEWIPVSERLPEHGPGKAHLVLVYIQKWPKGYYETAMMYPDGKWSHGAANQHVTHWQELPAPPELKAERESK